MKRKVFALSGLLAFLFLVYGCSSPSPSSSPPSSISSSAGKKSFVEVWNDYYPDNLIVEADIRSYATGAGSATDIIVDDVVCHFGESDGTPTFSVLSNLPLDANGRSTYLDQAAKAIAIRYELPLATAEDVMGEFRGNSKESKSIKSHGIDFYLRFEVDQNNYKLFTIKN